MDLPPHVRRNDFWDPAVLASSPQSRMQMSSEALTPGMAAVVTAMKQLARDPSQGTVERRVLADGDSILELEERAARMATERAGVSLDRVDLLLTHRVPSEYQLSNPACELHERLALPRKCCSLQTVGAQHSFLLQLSIAQAMISAGQANTALLVQSSAMSRLLDYTDALSLAFGDGATAVVVGHVGSGRGILSSTHYTEGANPHTLVASVPGKPWYADGRAILHLADMPGPANMLLRTVDMSKASIGDALKLAGIRADEVDVLAMHQGMPWLRRLVQEQTGLTHARPIDTFSKTGHLFGAFVPSTLVAAERDGLLNDGDVVVVAGGGSGMTYGASVIRWGHG